MTKNIDRRAIALMRDLLDRRDIKHIVRGCDFEVKLEMLRAWTRIIKPAALNRAADQAEGVKS